MPRPLYGIRYIRPGAEDLVRIVSEDLHCWDYGTTLKFYDRFKRWSTDIRDFAFLACNDRFFLLTGLLNRRDALHPWVYDRCREVEDQPDGCLDLWARWHYKSTIITFAGSIEDIIRDPEVTICIFSHTRDIARAFLRQIKRECESNEKLRLVFPDVLWADPQKESPKWSEEDGIVVKRKGNPKEATLEGWGLVDGMPTSKHFQVLDYDDVVVPKSVTTPDQIKKTTEAWELSDNLGVGEKTRKRMTGTRYNLADTWQDIIDRKLFKVRRYPATHNGRKDGHPVFMSPEQWQHILRTQRSTYPAQMLLNPAAGNEAAFELAWLKPYEVRPSILNVYILMDPSAGRKKTSDRTAIAVIGVDVAKNKYLLDGYCHRMKLSERWKNLRRLHKKWTDAPGCQFVYVGYETFGQQGSDVDQFKEWMIDDRYEFQIEELTKGASGEVTKVDRVCRLQPDIEGVEANFFFPYAVYVEGSGICKWTYNEDTSLIEYDPIETTEHFRDQTGKLRVRRTGDYFLTSLQKRAIEREQKWTIARPIKAVDEEGEMYDLTRKAFEELKYFPHRIGHDDLVDAMSRVYDHPSYAAPVPFEATKIMTPVWE